MYFDQARTISGRILIAIFQRNFLVLNKNKKLLDVYWR